MDLLPPPLRCDWERHLLFLERIVDGLPLEYETQEINRLTLAYFAISGLNLLDALDRMVGYNLSNINPEAILKSMRKLQQHDGSFVPIHFRAETDLRFVYCAAAICSMLDNWTGMDKEKVKEYIVRCQSYDGGFGLVPGSESHGGATFCAVAALLLMGFVGEDIFPNQEGIDMPLLVEWLLQRQSGDGGFQGRIHKPSDTCYAFWWEQSQLDLYAKKPIIVIYSLSVCDIGLVGY